MEATAIVREFSAIRKVKKWFEGLRSSDVKARLDTPAEFARLLHRWLARGKYEEGASSGRPSLLSAICSESPLLQEAAFIWYTTDAMLSKSVVKDAARRQGILLSRGRDSWEWFEDQHQHDLLKRMRRAHDGKYLIAWEVKMDDGHVKKFMAHQPRASWFIDAIRLRGFVVSYFGTRSPRPPFDPRAQRGELARILTRGFNGAEPRLQRAIENNQLGLLSPSQLVELVQLGLRS
jgi:hypothetical protein